MIITSVNNELIKETAKLLQKKYRDLNELFLLEGEKCIDEAIESGIIIERIFEQEGLNKYNDAIIVTENVLSKISSTVTAPKAVAVAHKISTEWSDNFHKVVLLEDIKDAGNLGTILRSAAAFNIDAVILYGDSVDLYNPKCVRSSVGNLWKIPIFSFSSFDDVKNKFDDFERIATLPKANNTTWLNDYIPAEKTIVMFGTESSGLSDELKAYATKNVTIEMAKNVESLNLSISAGIFLYKLFL